MSTNTTNTPIGISFADTNPSKSDNIASGYPISQEWFNKNTGERFFHKMDGIWVSYTSTDSIGEAPVMFADVATTVQFDGSYNNGVDGVGATLTRSTNGTLDVDGVRLNLDVVVLVKDQPAGDFEFGMPSLQYQNGVYIVTQAGTSVLPVILTRVDFADETSEIYPSQVNILDGVVNRDKFFLEKEVEPVIGVDPIVYETKEIPPTAQVVLPVVFVDTATTEPLPSCTYSNIYNPVVPGQSWYLPFPIGATLTANTNGPLGTINGVLMGNSFANRNNRILVKNQVDKKQNGDYQVVNAGSSTTPWVLQRITTYGSSMVRSSREWKVNNDASSLYGNRYNLINSTPAIKVGIANLEFSEISSSLGLIRIVDKDGDFFTDLTTAGAYIRTFTSATITNESFSNGTYWFTVSESSDFSNATEFLYGSGAYIEDELGLINTFGTFAFNGNSGNNVLGNVTLGNYSFGEAYGVNKIGNLIVNGTGVFSQYRGVLEVKKITITNPTDDFGDESIGRFVLNESSDLIAIGTTYGNDYPNFFTDSTAVICAHKRYETINAGGIEGDLATAQTNGAKLFFGYEKPQISEVLVTGLLTGGGSSSSITIGTDPTIATGSGVFGYVPYWNSAQNLSSTSSIYNVGTNVGISNFSPTHPLTIGSSASGIGGQISLHGRTSGNVVIKTSDVTSSWTASLPTTKGSITPFVYSNFGGEIMLNDGNGNLFFGTTPSLSLSENTVFIGNTYGYAKSRTLMGDIYSDYTGTITINNGVVSYQKMQTVSQPALLGSTIAGGPVTEIPYFDFFIPLGTIATNLENVSNWSAGAYIGPAITGTYQGQSHYDSSYYFMAVEDNQWIRILRA